MKKKCEKGLLSLEASITLTLFIFMMLFLYSFFVFFEARNEVAHNLLASANSLSLDTYEAKKLGDSGKISQLIYALYSITRPEGNGFYSTDQWSRITKNAVDEETWDETIYASSQETVYEPDEYGNVSTGSSALASAIVDRFVSYISDGNTAGADEVLDKLHIVGGVNGLDFSKSHISSGKLYLTVRYTIELEFNLFGLGMLEMEQSCCSRLWQ